MAMSSAFLISLIVHGFLFVFPKINLPASKIEPLSEIEITFIEPRLLPPISQLGEEIKIKPNLSSESITMEGKDTQAILRYQDIIKQKIQKARRYPQWARQQKCQGTTALKFTITRNGSIQNIQILRSSGYKILDEEALNTLNRGRPFPRIPEKIPFSEIQMEIHIVFQLV